MSAVAEMPKVRGKLTRDAPLAPLVWFKTGGNADWLFEPADAEDLADFLGALDPDVPVMALGLGSNLIVRDGGVPGIVVRLGKAFAKIEQLDDTLLRCGGGASGILVSSTARDAGLTVPEYAAQTATRWQEGLAASGLGPDRIQALRDAAEVTLYTPGSEAGVPLNVMVVPGLPAVAELATRLAPPGAVPMPVLRRFGHVGLLNLLYIH